MRSAIDRIMAETTEETKSADYPFPWGYSLKLLGIIIDCQWSFQENLQIVRSKGKRRFDIIKRAASASWGLESRIPAVTTHALVESIIVYGLAMTGSHATLQERQDIDKVAINPSARSKTGAGFTSRRESPRIMADTRAMVNHYKLKTANMEDRTMRASGANARKNEEKFAGKYYKINKMEQNSNYFVGWRATTARRNQERKNNRN